MVPTARLTGWLAATAIWAVFFWLAYYIATRLDAGVDISDTGFYLISLTMHHAISAQVTLFGPLWDSISPFDAVHANRLLALALVLMSSAFVTLRLLACYGTGRAGQVAVFALPSAATTALCYYYFWLPDPSYNLINFILLNLVLGSVVSLVHLLKQDRAPGNLSLLTWTAVLSASGLTLALIKITTAAMMAPVVLAWLGLALYRRKEPALLKVIALGVAAGLLVPPLLLASTGYTPMQIVAVLVRGAEVAQLITEPHFNPAIYLFRHYVMLWDTVRKLGWMGLPFPMLAIVWMLDIVRARTGAAKRPWLSFLGNVLLAASLVVLWAASEQSAAARLGLVAFLGQMAALKWMICAADPRAAFRQFLPLLAITAYAYVAFCFGTNSSWTSVLATATFLALLPAIVIYAMSKGAGKLVAAALAAGAAAITASAIETAPYRMNSSFSALTEIAPVGPASEPFRVNAPLAEFYRNLASARETYLAAGPKPMLLDMTGRTPMASYQLGTRPPGSAWILSGYPGSEKMFRFFLSDIPATDVTSAWLLVPDQQTKSLPLSLLKEIGLDFPADYIAVTNVPIPYLKIRATLYRPR